MPRLYEPTRVQKNVSSVRGEYRATGSGGVGEMSQAVDPRLAYAQGPAPAVTTAAPSEPEPQPSPSPNPPPTPPSPQPPIWGGDPDVGVSSSFLRGRADDCDTTSRLIRGTRGAAED